ncbi:MAG: hypothetical protein KKA64_02600 [Nanoarchaeota archaeon]|nr:hypothetical protein [Nanoarchaeota archaeon]
MGIEDDTLSEFRKIEGAKECKYFCTELIVKTANPNFNPYKFAQFCTQEEKQKLGYLSDLILNLKEDNVLKQRTYKNLEKLSELFKDQYPQWVHISAKSKEVKRWMEQEPMDSLNYKWRVYPTILPEDIFDWLDLYQGDYLKEIMKKKDIRQLLLKKKGFLRIGV